MRHQPQQNPADGSFFGFLGDKGKSSELQTAQYYASIGAPKNLDDFKTKYGFPTDEVTATYYNDGDLGFGREMHCRLFFAVYGFGVACYVKNFGDREKHGAFPADPRLALELAASGHNHFATVAMVYTPPNRDNAIQFMVYGPENSKPGLNEALQLNAQLDEGGENKSIPNNCLACHGISSTVKLAANPLPNTPVVSEHARFLPFDMYSFKYSTIPSLSLAAQQPKFELLNLLVSLTPMTPATQDFLKGLYGGVMPGASGASPTNRAIPAQWSVDPKDKSVHEGVYKLYCRTCHITSVKPSLDFFDNPAEFSVSPVCNPTHRMPHAEQTLRKFWNSGARALLSQRYGLAASDDCSK
jgi:hypothetical protein